MFMQQSIRETRRSAKEPLDIDEGRSLMYKLRVDEGFVPLLDSADDIRLDSKKILWPFKESIDKIGLSSKNDFTLNYSPSNLDEVREEFYKKGLNMGPLSSECSRILFEMAKGEIGRDRSWKWLAEPSISILIQEILFSGSGHFKAESFQYQSWRKMLLIEPLLHADGGISKSRVGVKNLGSFERELALVQIWRDQEWLQAFSGLNGANIKNVQNIVQNSINKVLKVSIQTIRELCEDLQSGPKVVTDAINILNAAKAVKHLNTPEGNISPSCPLMDLSMKSCMLAVIACIVYASCKLSGDSRSFSTVVSKLQDRRFNCLLDDEHWFKDLGGNDLLQFFNSQFLPRMRDIIYTSVGGSSLLLGARVVGKREESTTKNQKEPQPNLIDREVRSGYVGKRIFVAIRPTNPAGTDARPYRRPYRRLIFAEYGFSDQV
jgi:hypothetical protein